MYISLFILLLLSQLVAIRLYIYVVLKMHIGRNYVKARIYINMKNVQLLKTYTC